MRDGDTGTHNDLVCMTQATHANLPMVTTAAPAGSKSNLTLPPFNASKHFA